MNEVCILPFALFFLLLEYLKKNTMIVTLFKNIWPSSPAFYKDVDYVLARIKRGDSWAKLKIIRAEKDKEKRGILKKELPSICFSGRFKKRAAAALIEHSGFICLDFDGFEDAEKLKYYRTKLSQDKFSYAVFTSPSGNGLKVLTKIPPVVEFHKKYFAALMAYHKVKYFDKSTSDVSRVCYESYDPDIYINKDSVLWEEIPCEVEELGDGHTNIPLTSEYEIIERIFTWFNKNYSMFKGERNSNIFKLAASFNSFGVNQSTCESSLMQYKTEDFPATEITNAIKQAYKKTHEFGNSKFEDVKKKTNISNAVKNGMSKEEIKSETGATDRDIQKVRSEITTEVFWEYTQKGSIKISHHDFKLFLQEEGFSKYYPSENGKHTLIRVKCENIIQSIEASQVKDYTLNYLESDFATFGKPVYNFFAENTKYFKDDFLTFLDSKDVQFNQDTKEHSYLYFKNEAVKISKNKIEQIPYENIDGFIWENQIIDRDFKKSSGDKSIYRKFIWLLAGKNEDRYNSLKSTIGYLLHSYKNSTNNKAVILNDETISENPNGGSGKGIFSNAIGKMKKLSVIDGKQFSFEKSFPYQTVSPDTQILLFDDVRKNFAFENLFSIITEGITLEKKNKDAIMIPVERSPKILITTNYTIGGIGGSFERRKHELEFSSHFNDNHTPHDEFGHMFFDGWSDEEWSKFDSYMLECLQYYLKNGLVSSSFKNLHARKFIKETSSEFYEWAIVDECIDTNMRYEKKPNYDEFTDEYQDLKKWLTRKRYNAWLRLLAKYKGLEYQDGQSNGQRWFMLFSEEEPEPAIEPMPF